MNVGIVGNRPGQSLARFQALPDPSLNFTFIPWDELSATVGDSECVDGMKPAPDVVLVRGMPRGSLEQVIFQMNMLARWHALQVPVVNPPRALEIAIDKYLSLTLLREAGLAVPETVVAQTVDRALEGFQCLGGDVVIKPVFGGEGRGMIRVTEYEMAVRCAQAIVNLGGVVFLQEFVDANHEDLRVLAIGDRMFAMQRKNSADWRANATRGAVCKTVNPDPSILEMARIAMEAVGTQIAGVDLITDSEGQTMVLEVNGVPGWQAISQVCGVNVEQCVADHLKTLKK